MKICKDRLQIDSSERRDHEKLKQMRLRNIFLLGKLVLVHHIAISLVTSFLIGHHISMRTILILEELVNTIKLLHCENQMTRVLNCMHSHHCLQGNRHLMRSILILLNNHWWLAHKLDNKFHRLMASVKRYQVPLMEGRRIWQDHYRNRWMKRNESKKKRSVNAF